jgi:multidrug efflux pump subunit AcrA (membrane-fusion protein)
MSEEKEKPNIELRSEDVQDILNRPPNWMIRWGNTVLISVIVLMFTLSYFIKYPDVIMGRATISTEKPPVFINSKVSGRMRALHIENKQAVREGQVIAEIENPIPASSIDSLQNFLTAASHFLTDPNNQTFLNFKRIELYEVSNDFSTLKNILEEYRSHLYDNVQAQQLNDLENKLSANIKLQEISIREAELSKVDISYAKERYSMQEEEYELGLTTKLDFLGAQSAYNQSLKAEEGIKKSLIQMELTIEDYKSQVRNAIAEGKTKTNEYRNRTQELITLLENYVTRWKTEFTIRSPINGTLDYSGRIKVNQLINSGDQLFAIIPPSEQFETLLQLPAQGFGKVRIGQKVKLKLDNYPYNEYGFVNGAISNLAALPSGDIYQVQVALDKGLTTSYNSQLEYSPEMMATAEVITEDLRLIERLFNSLRSIFDN